VSTGEVIFAIVALIWGVSCLVGIVGVFFIEWVLMPWHRRRTGSELIEPIPPGVGAAALTLGHCLVSPWFQRRTGHVIMIDLAPRWWRWIVLATTWAEFGFVVSFVVAVLLKPDIFF
jgi:hypothetical protein